MEEMPALSSESFDLRSSSENPVIQPSVRNERHEGVLVLSHVKLTREFFIEALGSILKSVDVRGAENFVAAFDVPDVAEPALVLIDVTLTNGLAAVRRLHQRDAAVKIVAFCVDKTVQDVAAWTDAGVAACIRPSFSMQDIAGVIRDVLDGVVPHHGGAGCGKPLSASLQSDGSVTG